MHKQIGFMVIKIIVKELGFRVGLPYNNRKISVLLLKHSDFDMNTKPIDTFLLSLLAVLQLEAPLWRMYASCSRCLYIYIHLSNAVMRFLQVQVDRRDSTCREVNDGSCYV